MFSKFKSFAYSSLPNYQYLEPFPALPFAPTNYYLESISSSIQLLFLIQLLHSIHITLVLKDVSTESYKSMDHSVFNKDVLFIILSNVNSLCLYLSGGHPEKDFRTYLLVFNPFPPPVHAYLLFV